MVTLIFESHGGTLDNENKVVSGHFDAKLSPIGLEQAKKLGQTYKDNLPDVVFCSDISRSYETAEAAFGKRVPIIKDKRLRPCNYGTHTHMSSEKIKQIKLAHIYEPFPDGESYEQATSRVKDFLAGLAINYDNKTVMVIGHRVTQLGIESWVSGAKLEDIIESNEDWQPGKIYKLF